jgi:uncharacterized protein YndB with AHSA1/START domain
MTPSAVVQRLLPASAEVVYDAWLDVNALTEFMCPDPACAAHVECDPRVGGRFRIVMAYPNGTSEVRGEYLELNRPRRLRLTWTPDSAFESVVTVDLEPRGTDQTMMTITHTLLPDELAPAYDEGWSAIARHLAELLCLAPSSQVVAHS